MELLYFDYNATTPMDPEVAETMIAHMEQFGNPSSSHDAGYRSKKSVQLAREQTAALLGCEPPEVVFTSGGTESNNWVVKSMVSSWRREGKPVHLILSSIEHPSIRDVCRHLEDMGQVRLTYVPVDRNGFVSADDVRSAIRPDTRMISIMTANNEIGTIQPIREIASLAAERGIFMHTDAVQAAGKIPIDARDLGVDALSFSGHKFYGPKGIGGLYIRQGLALEPLLHGGGQETGRRSGTENVLSIIGLGKACELALSEAGAIAQRMAQYKKLFLELTGLAQIGLRVNGASEGPQVLPYTLNVQLPGIRGEALAAYLDHKFGAAVSIGSACSSNKERKLSHVLAGLGLPEDEIRSSIRISFGKYTTEAHIRLLAGALREAALHFRSLLPA